MYLLTFFRDPGYIPLETFENMEKKVRFSWFFRDLLDFLRIFREILENLADRDEKRDFVKENAAHFPEFDDKLFEYQDDLRTRPRFRDNFQANARRRAEKTRSNWNSGRFFQAGEFQGKRRKRGNRRNRAKSREKSRETRSGRGNCREKPGEWRQPHAEMRSQHGKYQ